MMTQFDCDSSRTESQTNNLASEKREGGEERRGREGRENGRGVKIVVLMKARFLKSLALLLTGMKNKKVEKKKTREDLHFTPWLKLKMYSTVCMCVLFSCFMAFSLTLTPQTVWNHNFDDYFCKLCGLSCLHPFPRGRFQRYQLKPGKRLSASQHKVRNEHDDADLRVMIMMMIIMELRL